MARWLVTTEVASPLTPHSTACLPVTLGAFRRTQKGNLWVVCGNALLRWRDGRFVPGLSEREAALFDPKIAQMNSLGILWVTNREGLRFQLAGVRRIFAR